MSTGDLHKKACREKKDYYIDTKTGAKVMTEYFLIKRGFCCSSGCRHCPYEWDMSGDT